MLRQACLKEWVELQQEATKEQLHVLETELARLPPADQVLHGFVVACAHRLCPDRAAYENLI